MSFSARDLAAGFGLLTRLPVGHLAGPDLAGAVWTYPLAGAAIGGFAALVYACLSALHLPPLLAALWAIAGMMLLTGGLHEDGLADTADGLGGGRTPSRRLEIMRDSRIGAFGAMALLLAVAIRVAALAQIATPWHVAAALIVAGALGRAAILLVLARAAPARPDGLSAGLAAAPATAILVGCGLAAMAAVALLPPGRALLACALAACSGWATASLATRRIGGHTGDILGAAEVLAECLVLTLLAAP